MTLAAGAFTDPTIPSGYGRFAIHAIGGDICVTDATQDPSMTDEVVGAEYGQATCTRHEDA